MGNYKDLIGRLYGLRRHGVIAAEFTPVADAFIANMRRVEVLAFFPARASVRAHFQQLAIDEARLKLLKKIILTPEEVRSTWAEIKPVADSIFQKMNISNPAEYNAIVAALEIDESALSDAEFLEGTPALLDSVLIGIWTACENMLGDLWEVCLNLGPKEWSHSTLKAMDGPGLKEDQERTAKNQEKVIPLKAISEIGYDLRTKMGTLLRKSKRADFESLANAKRAYAAAFGPRINDELFSKPKYAELPVIESCRNLLAHRGGIVDERFRQQVAKLNQFCGIRIGEKLNLTGELVATYFVMAVDLSYDLFLLVGTKMPSMEALWYPMI